MERNILEKYYLNLEKISEIKSDTEKDLIHGLYRDLLNYLECGRKPEATFVFNTLEAGGYLVSIREEKIEKILG